MPSMLDPVFGGTVVYLCEHTSDGALGMIINRPTDMTMGVLFIASWVLRELISLAKGANESTRS